MPTLRFISLTCHAMNDLLGQDDVHIKANGLTIMPSFSMRAEEVIHFGPARNLEFETDVKLSLWERDSDEDDHLGDHHVTAAEAGQGEKSVRFGKATRGDYTLLYAVDA